ncbi:hypothetical protein K491DRAFT_684778 [Lophiostoma macrostomum CBS 122681]|uniref:Uncharacterized protein n=1 Tax=Lophiostoma macrostomum CBS 122681 TaxID=1314788 RepID=A0A6A6SKG6_9PLEO|nr:hypothetical protein K491DRAFT_684778 [Lophiostoma macrostomum CBS 122681]
MIYESYQERKYIIEPVYKTEGINMHPFRLFERYGRFTADGGLLLGGIVGAAISVFRLPGLHEQIYQRALAGFSVGGFVGSLTTRIGSNDIKATIEIRKSQQHARNEVYWKLLSVPDSQIMHQLSRSADSLLRLRARDYEWKLRPSKSDLQAPPDRRASSEFPKRIELAMARAFPILAQDTLTAHTRELDYVTQIMERKSREYEESGRTDEILNLQLEIYAMLRESLLGVTTQFEVELRNESKGRLDDEARPSRQFVDERNRYLTSTMAATLLEKLQELKADRVNALEEKGDIAGANRILASWDTVIWEYEMELERRKMDCFDTETSTPAG